MYTGGSIDLSKPQDKNMYRYDGNSLYPFIIKNFPIPLGAPYYFVGNILDIDKDAFDFFNLKVKLPKTIENPILQTKINSGNVIKTVCLLRTWSGMYFFKEIKNAIKYDYEFEVRDGY